jgi:hypothetical protein
MSPVRYELSFYIPEDGPIHSYRCYNHEAYKTLTDWVL